MIDQLIAFDKSIFLELNGWGAPYLDAFMVFVSGKLEWIPLYAVLLYFVFKQYKQKGFYILFFVILLIVASDQISVNLFKNIFERFRPCHDPSLEGLVRIVNDKCGGKFGFVSSHATNTFALATFIGLILKSNKWLIALLVWASVVSFSRIYLGVHFPLDVFCGALLGVAIAFLIRALLRFVDRKFNFGINS
jgi:undecaprenyl-diphosphatase